MDRKGARLAELEPGDQRQPRDGSGRSYVHVPYRKKKPSRRGSFGIILLFLQYKSFLRGNQTFEIETSLLTNRAIPNSVEIKSVFDVRIVRVPADRISFVVSEAAQAAFNNKKHRESLV